MSITDKEIEPPDDDADETVFCREHQQYRPCPVCRIEAVIERAEERYKKER